MANDYTGRFKWPIPPWNADWQKWQQMFSTFSTGADATAFSLLEHLTFIPSFLPDVRVVLDGGKYYFDQKDPARFISRTFQTEITIAKTYLELTIGGLICAHFQSGALGPQSVDWEIRVSQTEIDADLVVMGYVNADYTITWYNGSVLPVGVWTGLFDFGGGGGTAGPIWTGVEEYWVDVDNGTDDADPSRGSFNFPYATLAFAAAQITAPAIAADFTTPVVFHVASGEYSDPVTILPYRSAHAIIVTSGTILSGAIDWQLDVDPWVDFGVSQVTNPPVLVIGSDGVAYMGDLNLYRNPNVSLVGLNPKNVGIQNVYLAGTISNQPSGDTAQPTGALRLALLNCARVGGGTWLESYGEDFGLPGWVRNTTYLGAQNCTLPAAAHGDITIAACYDSLFGIFGSAVPGSESIIEGESTYGGLAGFVNCTFKDPIVLGSATPAYSVPQLRYIRFDASSYERARVQGITFQGFVAPAVGFPEGYVLTDHARGVGVDTSGFAGSLGPTDYDVQRCLDALDFAIASPGGPLGYDAIYVDATRGNDATATGTFALPWQTFEAALASVAAPVNINEWNETARFYLAPGFYTVTGAVDLPQRRTVEICGLAYYITGNLLGGDYLRWVKDGAALFGANFSDYRRRLVFCQIVSPTGGWIRSIPPNNMDPRVSVCIKHERDNAPDGGDPSTADNPDTIEFVDVRWNGQIVNDDRAVRLVSGSQLGEVAVLFRRTSFEEGAVQTFFFGSYSEYPGPNYESNAVRIILESADLNSGTASDILAFGYVKVGDSINSTLYFDAYYSIDYSAVPFAGCVCGRNGGLVRESYIATKAGNFGQDVAFPVAFGYDAWSADSYSARFLPTLPDNLGRLDGGIAPKTYVRRADQLDTIKYFPSDSVIVVEQLQSGTPGEFYGSAVGTAYNNAKLLTPGGDALASNNRAVVLVPPGKYVFDSPFTVDTDFVDIIAMDAFERMGNVSTDVPAVSFVYDHAADPVMYHNTDDVRLKGIHFKNLGNAPGVMFSTSRGDWSRYDGCRFSTTGLYAVTVDGVTTEIYANFHGCTSPQGLIGDCTFVGEAYDCEGGHYSFGGGQNRGGCTGKLERCTSGNYSFGYSDVGGAECSATLVDCHGAEQCFGSAAAGAGVFSGDAHKCTASLKSFGYSDDVGVISLCSGDLSICESGDKSFGFNEAGEARFSGTAFKVTGGDYCFGSTLDNVLPGKCTVASRFEHCDAGAQSFGSSSIASGGSDEFAGAALDCTASTKSFGGVGTFSGSGKSVVAAGNSFGASGADGVTGWLIDSQCTGRTMGLVANGGHFINCYISANAGSIFDLVEVAAGGMYAKGSKFDSAVGAVNSVVSTVGGAGRNVRITHCDFMYDFSVDITNLIGVPFNTVDVDNRW